jgi:hypothetical protein
MMPTELKKIGNVSPCWRHLWRTYYNEVTNGCNCTQWNHHDRPDHGHTQMNNINTTWTKWLYIRKQLQTHLMMGLWEPETCRVTIRRKKKKINK